MEYSILNKKLYFNDLASVNQHDILDFTTFTLIITNKYDIRLITGKKFKKIIINSRYINKNLIPLIIVDILSGLYFAESYDLILSKIDKTLRDDKINCLTNNKIDKNNPIYDVSVDIINGSHKQKIILADITDVILFDVRNGTSNFFWRVNDLIRKLIINCKIDVIDIDRDFNKIIGNDVELKQKINSDLLSLSIKLIQTHGHVYSPEYHQYYYDFILRTSVLHPKYYNGGNIFDYYQSILVNSNITNFEIRPKNLILYLKYCDCLTNLKQIKLVGSYARKYTHTKLRADVSGIYDYISNIFEKNKISIVVIDTEFIAEFPDIFKLFSNIKKLYLICNYECNSDTCNNILNLVSMLNLKKLRIYIRMRVSLASYSVYNIIFTFLSTCNIANIKIILNLQFVIKCTPEKLLNIATNKNINNLCVLLIPSNIPVVDNILLNKNIVYEPGSFDHLQKIKISHSCRTLKVFHNIIKHNLTDQSELIYYRIGKISSLTVKELTKKNIELKLNQRFKVTKAIDNSM